MLQISSKQNIEIKISTKNCEVLVYFHFIHKEIKNKFCQILTVYIKMLDGT